MKKNISGILKLLGVIALVIIFTKTAIDYHFDNQQPDLYYVMLIIVGFTILSNKNE
jgi:hypothetical protein